MSTAQIPLKANIAAKSAALKRKTVQRTPYSARKISPDRIKKDKEAKHQKYIRVLQDHKEQCLNVKIEPGTSPRILQTSMNLTDENNKTISPIN